MADPSIKEGTIPFQVDGQTYQTWYKVVGDLHQHGHRPLIALHGGPGLIHDYMTPLADLTRTHGIPVVLYDQLGNGRSTHLREKPTSFWTIDLFVAELTNVVRALGIEDEFDLIGHSWGGILGVETELRLKPKGLRRLVLTDTLPAMDLWNRSTAELMAPFPEDVRQGLMMGFADSKRYHAALLQFHAKHGCTLKPPPDEYIRTLDAVFGENGDPTVGIGMFSGALRDWSAIDRLHEIRVPALVINGRDDISQDFVCAPFFQHIQRVKWVTFGNSSHTPMWEERERYIKIVGDFLKLPEP